MKVNRINKKGNVIIIGFIVLIFSSLLVLSNIDMLNNGFDFKKTDDNNIRFDYNDKWIELVVADKNNNKLINYSLEYYEENPIIEVIEVKEEVIAEDEVVLDVQEEKIDKIINKTFKKIDKPIFFNGFVRYGLSLGSNIDKSNVNIIINSSEKLQQIDRLKLGYLDTETESIFDIFETSKSYNLKVLDFTDLQDKNPDGVISLVNENNQWILKTTGVTDFDPTITDIYTSNLGGTYNQTEWYSTWSGLGLQDDGVLLYTFDENTTGNIVSDIDYSVNDLNDTHGLYNLGDNQDGYSAFNTGVVGNALSFDGVGNYLRRQNATTPDTTYLTLNTTDEYSVNLWFKTNDSRPQMMVFHGGTDQIRFRWTSTYLGVSFYSPVTGYEHTYSVGTIPSNNNWYMATFIMYQGNLTYYINGAFDSSLLLAINNYTANDYTDIGTGSGSDNYFNGTIDEVKIFNRSLSAEEISAIYGNESLGVSDPNMDRVNLTIEATMNDTVTNLDNIEFDSSTYGNNWTIANYYRPYYNLTGGYSGTGAYEFDGNNDYISITDSTNNLFAFNTSNFSVSLWLKTNQSTNYFVEVSRVSTYGWSAQIQGGVNSGVPDFFLATNPDGNSNCANWGGKSVTDNLWHNVVYMMNDTGRYIYIDGVYEVACAGTYDLYQAGLNLNIGILQGIYYNGTLDEIKLFNRSLDETEILALNNSNPLMRFYNSGDYISNSHSISTGIDSWDNVTINCTMFNNTVQVDNDCGSNVTVNVRTSVDNSTWGDWVTTTQDGNSYNINTLLTSQFFQYQLYGLSSNDLTPLVTQVDVNYTARGVGGGGGGGASGGFATSPNITIDILNNPKHNYILGNTVELNVQTYKDNDAFESLLTSKIYVDNTPTFILLEPEITKDSTIKGRFKVKYLLDDKLIKNGQYTIDLTATTLDKAYSGKQYFKINVGKSAQVQNLIFTSDGKLTDFSIISILIIISILVVIFIMSMIKLFSG